LDLRVDHLEVRYGDLLGIADVWLQVRSGTVVALLGSNGAGKTTMLNAIMNLARPSRGSIIWHGESIGGGPAFAILRRGLALSPEAGGCLFRRPLSRICDGGQRRSQIAPTISRSSKAFTTCFRDSPRGDTALGRALMNDRRLLLLDEPVSVWLRRPSRRLYETLQRLHRVGLTLLLPEQSIPMALEIADYAYVLQTVRTALEGSADALRRDPQVQRIYLALGDEPRAEVAQSTCHLATARRRSAPPGAIERGQPSFRQFGRWMPLEGVIMSQ
jgi:branched-chain amino acid transport system ATP-binding protein